MTGFTPQLREHLAITGVHLGDGFNRRARWSQCVDCHRPVIRGLDAPRLAQPVTAEGHEIDEIGEFLALAAGLGTHHLLRIGGDYVISVRWPEHIRAGRQRPVIADHRCDLELPAAVTPLIRTRSIATATGDEPDF